jgi:hypothetical protein
LYKEKSGKPGSILLRGKYVALRKKVEVQVAESQIVEKISTPADSLPQLLGESHVVLG